jgi:hypothetical protein
VRFPDKADLGDWGAANYLSSSNFAMLVYDPEIHLRALGQEYDFSDDARYEVTITHAPAQLCYLNPAGAGRAQLDSLTWENVVNIFTILDKAARVPDCHHSDVPQDQQMRTPCPRCGGDGEFVDLRGRRRSCNCVEGRV